MTNRQRARAERNAAICQHAALTGDSYVKMARLLCMNASTIGKIVKAGLESVHEAKPGEPVRHVECRVCRRVVRPQPQHAKKGRYFPAVHYGNDRRRCSGFAVPPRRLFGDKP